MRYTGRTKFELNITEIIAIFYKRTKYGLAFDMGKKPGFLPKNVASSMREYRSLIYKNAKLNPVVEAKRIKLFIDQNNDLSYHEISLRFGVSKARVSQMVSLLKNIPEKIINFMETNNDPEFLCFFTERKLRKLIALKTDIEKDIMFKEMITVFNEKKGGDMVFSLVR